MSKQKYIEKAIKWARSRRLSGIKANLDGYETPTGFTRPGEDQPYVPDLTARKTGRKCYIEIAMKTDDVRRRVSKWKLMETLARLKGGKFFLLAPRGHKAFTERMIEKHELNTAQLIYLKN